MMNSFKEWLESVLGQPKAPNFRYQGSKFIIREWVLSYMPTKGRIYVEPFAGRGNMFFLAKQRLSFQQWHINDLNSIPFFKSVLSVDMDAIPNRSSQGTFMKLKQDPSDLSRVMEPALSHMGHYRGGWAGQYSSSHNYDPKAYKEKISAARDMLQDVKMTNVTWQQMPLNRYTINDFVYLDPPYMSTDNKHYQKGADLTDHPRLLSTLNSLKSKWLLSHTYHPLYVKELGKPIAMKERGAVGKMYSMQKNTGQKIIECLWKGNY